MRKLTYILFSIFFLLTVIIILIKPISIFIIRQKLDSIFEGADITITDISVAPFKNVTIEDISIFKEGFYSYKINEISVDYSVSELLNKTINTISIHGMDIKLIAPKKNISEAVGITSRKSKVKKEQNINVKKIDIYKAKLEISTKDINLESKVSLICNLTSQKIESLDLKIYNFNNGNIYVKNTMVNIPKSTNIGEFYCENIKVDKFDISNVNSMVMSYNKKISLYSLSSDLMSGEASGEISLSMDGGFVYDLLITLKEIQMDTIIKTFEWDNKIALNGSLGGLLEVRGKTNIVDLFEGNFMFSHKGGTLEIVDKVLLERLSKSTGQSIEVIEASFKLYRYNSGFLTLSMVDNHIMMNLQFDGNDGKRDFTVTLHDFLTESKNTNFIN